MGRAALIIRLAARDLRRRRIEIALLLAALSVAATTLTLGLILHGQMDAPYARTRLATRGPDLVASVLAEPFHPVSSAQLSELAGLTHAAGVVAHSGPYPLTWTVLGAGSVRSSVQIEGRDQGAAAVDQPALTAGTWVRPGGIVLERAFADALGARVGNRVTVGARTLRVVGIAVTTAFTPYPRVCTGGCNLYDPVLRSTQPGLIWATRADTVAAATRTEPLAYVSNLQLRDPVAAPAFAAAHNNFTSPGSPMLRPWQDISYYASKLERNERQILMTGSWLLALIGVATVAVLVGARVADQTRRGGLLKAVGGTPALIATVLLAEFLVVSAIAVLLGLLAGRVIASMLAPPHAGLLGPSGSPTLRLSDVLVVSSVVVGITVLATFVPALRAARTSTVQALAGNTRTPHRLGRVVQLTRHLPVSLLLGVRISAHRPRRAVLAALTVAIAVAGVVVILHAQATLDSARQGLSRGLPDPNTRRLGEVMLVLTVLLTVMTMVNLTFTTSSAACDARISLAVTRALGATPGQTAAGLAGAQVLPALIGVALGWPAGIALFAALNSGGESSAPPLWWLLAIVPATVLLTAALTALPARAAARRPVAELLSAAVA